MACTVVYDDFDRYLLVGWVGLVWVGLIIYFVLCSSAAVLTTILVSKSIRFDLLQHK